MSRFEMKTTKLNREKTTIKEHGEGMPLLQSSEKMNYAEKLQSNANENTPLSEEVINIEDDEVENFEKGHNTSDSNNMNTVMEAVQYISKHPSNCRITFMDFAGQSIYYALHSIYLSPKTVYILVLDMSKSFKDKEIKSSRKTLTRFESWEYKGN